MSSTQQTPAQTPASQQQTAAGQEIPKTFLGPIARGSEGCGDEDLNEGPKVFPCPARNCREFFVSTTARRRHARDHENDEDMEHLAAYYYCCVAGCQFTQVVYDHKGLSRHSEVPRHLSAAIGHSGDKKLSDQQQKSELALIMTRNHLARQNLGLRQPVANPAAAPLPSHGGPYLLPVLLP
jgi:hypothetical protein